MYNVFLVLQSPVATSVRSNIVLFQLGEGSDM